MEKARKILIPVVAALLGAFVAFAATFVVLNGRVAALQTQLARLTPPESADYDQSKLNEIQTLLDQYFIADIDKDTMTEAMAEGMITGLGDRWSYYISADEYASYLESVTNSYVGIGLTIVADEDSGALRVTDVTPDSPAYKAGIVVGDLLVKAEGQSTAELGMTETKNIVRGEEGTDVTVTISHDGVERDVVITRESIKTVNVTYEMLDSGVAYIRIRNFEQDCADDTIAAIEDMRAQGAKGLVFDLRFNPGGLKTELLELLDYLLPEGILFRSQIYDGSENTDYSDASYLDMPMSVLVNADSYSAAEFFAAAMQEYDAATVVGTQTSGKGYFQTSFQLSDGSAINISIGKYCTPKGVSLAGVGITPDEIVEISQEDYASVYYGTMDEANDEQLQKAVRAINP